MVKQLIFQRGPWWKWLTLAVMWGCILFNVIAQDLTGKYILATGENGTEEVYVADKILYTNWLNDAVLWMPFPAEKLAGTYYDYSRQGNDGTQTTPAFRPLYTNAWGGAYEFDGSDNRFNVADSSSLDLTAAITMTAWIKPDTYGSHPNGLGRIMDKKLAAASGYYLAINQNFSGLGTQNLLFHDGDEIEVSNSGSVTLGVWQHVAVANDGSTVTFYVNGVAAGGDTGTHTMTANGNALNIGAGSSGTLLFNGVLDDTRIYNRALSATEITNLYTRTSGAYE